MSEFGTEGDARVSVGGAGGGGTSNTTSGGGETGWFGGKVSSCGEVSGVEGAVWNVRAGDNSGRSNGFSREGEEEGDSARVPKICG